MKIHLKVIIIVILLTAISPAKIINVPADQSTIQDGIDFATDGDTVLVQTGRHGKTYFDGKNIVVGSLFLTTGDPSYISNTVIDCGGFNSITFDKGEDSTAILIGFTITNGGYNGGIKCTNGSGPSLLNLRIIGNWGWRGGGIDCDDDAHPNLFNVQICSNNGRETGGGIDCYNSRMRLENVIICCNSAGITFPTIEGGGGICSSNSDMTLINVTIYGNTSLPTGGGITCFDPNLKMVNSIIWNNSPNEIYGSVDAFHSDIQGGWPGIGNIDADPMFVDTTNGDYRLQEGSPCIDAGIQDTMIIYNDGQDTLFTPQMKYYGDAPDIGAYEFDDPLSITREIKTPKLYSLCQNYPNPFNPTTTIRYDLPKASDVRIEVFNVAGQKIQTLLNEKMSAGSHQVEFSGQNLSSGIYFYQIQAGEFQDVKKMILLR